MGSGAWGLGFHPLDRHRLCTHVGGLELARLVARVTDSGLFDLHLYLLPQISCSDLSPNPTRGRAHPIAAVWSTFDLRSQGRLVPTRPPPFYTPTTPPQISYNTPDKLPITPLITAPITTPCNTPIRDCSFTRISARKVSERFVSLMKRRRDIARAEVPTARSGDASSSDQAEPVRILAGFHAEQVPPAPATPRRPRPEDVVAEELLEPFVR